MRISTILALAAGAVGLAAVAPDPAVAGFYNRDGCGMYSPLEPPVRGRPRAYRYDPRSWCYRQARYYPYFGSGEWVPRAEVRYRYRTIYHGPKYRYYPAWGYGWY